MELTSSISLFPWLNSRVTGERGDTLLTKRPFFQFILPGICARFSLKNDTEKLWQSGK